ncbi:MAG: hypothetical protein ACKO11_08540 [Cuspidothrix sp.]
MTPLKKQFPSQTGFNCLWLRINKSCFLQIGAVSVLMLLLAERATSEALLNLGEASEELFRGDRLPLLNFPDDDL